MNFRLKTMLGIALIEAILLIILTFGALDFLRDSNEDQLEKYASSTSRLFKNAVKGAVLSMDLVTLEDFVEEIASNPDIVYTRIISRDAILAESGNVAVLAQPRQLDKNISAVTDGIYDIRTQIVASGITYGVIEMGLSTTTMEQGIVKAKRWIGGIAALEIILVALFSFILGTLLTKQLLILKNATYTIGSSGPGHQIPVSGNDEISDVAYAFNEMSSKLNKVLVDQEKTSNDLALLNDQKDKRAGDLALANKDKEMIRQEADKAKSDFISTVSHELRTPLNAVIGLSQVLVNEANEIDPQKRAEYLTAIHSSGEHLLQLIGDILDLSKLDAGARSLEKRPFTILELIEVCHSTFNLTCQDKGITLIIDNQLKGPCPVLGDITVLKQILFNLLSNAIKFTDHGSISLTAAPHAVNGSGLCLGIMFAVADTGKGINADAICQLFTPFAQEDNSIARSYGGSGLGLNIAQKLAQLMGGQINCTSSEGHGSKFEMVVFLELRPDTFEQPEVTLAAMINLPPLKLLAVDDVDSNLMVVVALLTPQGHTIETVSNGQQAVEMASNNDYDAILMDVHMPGMSGIEATKIIRNFDNKKRATVPIIALSADVDVNQRDLFIAQGMNASLGKPWRVEELEKELQNLLNLS